MTDRDRPLVDAGVPALVREAIAGARARTPSPADLARIAARLPLGVPPASPPAAAPPSVLSGALIGAALGVVVSGAALIWDARGTAPPVPRPTVAAPTEAVRRAPERTAVPSVLARAPEVPTTTAHGATPPPAESAASAVGPLPSGEPAAELAPRGQGVGALSPPGEFEKEAQLLDRAREAVAANPAHALALTDEHAARFPMGRLGQEREVVAIGALVRLGRVEEAKARAARFTEAFPGSAHRSRIEAIVSP
jgi:hypothetical protein